MQNYDSLKKIFTVLMNVSLERSVFPNEYLMQYFFES